MVVFIKIWVFKSIISIVEKLNCNGEDSGSTRFQHFNRSLEIQHWSHFWTPEMKASIIAPEIIEFPFLVIALRAMYQGIEIDHPVFALLFYNLSFALICSAANICTLPILHMETWIRFALFVNGFFLQFHVICWSIISTLRSVYTSSSYSQSAIWHILMVQQLKVVEVSFAVLTGYVQSNSFISKSRGPAQGVRYNRDSL